ncbi:MAG: aspartate ammonia-lyase [Thermoanaerobacteraceae bacterium]|nr:aspartate ammonia-lyase [Thermoanaerobacteraceae bacterium]
MRTWSIEELKAKRRQGTFETKVPFVLDGKLYEVDKKIVNGEMETFELSKPIGEMLTSEASRKELVQKVVLDVELGREQVPILYTPIYERLQDPNFPKEFEAKWAQYGTVIFFEHMEGGEVKFGSLQAEEGPIARIKGYAAGFEYTKEMEIFNQTFNFELLNRAFGEAHNAILNHLHLGPIIQYSYKAANKTGPVYVDETGKVLPDQNGSHYILSLRATIKQALKDARTKKRPGSILLASSTDQEDIQDALGSFTIGATPYRALEGITDIIYYDGWNTQVGKKEYSYPGVSAGKAYLIRPKRGFKELIKQDLQINATMGDLTRLVESQIVGDFWRGVFAAIDENVQEITFPAQA